MPAPLFLGFYPQVAGTRRHRFMASKTWVDETKMNSVKPDLAWGMSLQLITLQSYREFTKYEMDTRKSGLTAGCAISIRSINNVLPLSTSNSNYRISQFMESQTGFGIVERNASKMNGKSSR
jgi:hypothetical protein